MNFRFWQMQNQSTKPPVFLKFRSSTTYIYSSIGVAVFTDLFLYGIIVPVLPFALTTRVGIKEEDVQHWISILLAVYGVALLVTSPFSGYFADHTTSRQAPLLIGLLALAGSTLMLCLARSIALFVLGRILQGCSAAVVWSVGIALLVDTADKNEVGQALGYVGIAMTMGIMLAPLLGGLVFERAGFVAVFGMAFGLLGLDTVMRLTLIEKKFAVKWIPEDRGAESTQESPEQSSDEGDKHNSMDISTSTLNGSVGLGKGEKDERAQIAVSINSAPSDQPSESSKKPQDLLARIKNSSFVVLLSSPRIFAALVGILTQATLLTSFDAVLPIFVKTTFLWPSLSAGLIFLPLVIPSLLAPIFGWASDRYGARWISTAGFLLVIPFYVLLQLVTENTIRQKVLLCGLLVGASFALSAIMTPLMAEITYALHAVEKKNPGIFGAKGAYAQAYSLFNIAFAGGAVVGPLWAGMVRDSAGWTTMSWSLGLLAGVMVIPNVVFVGGRLGKKTEDTESAIEGDAEIPKSTA